MEYYYIALTQQDLLKNQVIEEIVRERTNYYISRNNPFNFWILISPLFLLKEEKLEKIKKTNFYLQKKEEIIFNKKFYLSTIVSTSSEYINWIKLRLGYFEDINNLTENKNENFRSDGIYGKLNKNDLEFYSPFENKNTNIHPKLLINNFEKYINL